MSAKAPSRISLRGAIGLGLAIGIAGLIGRHQNGLSVANASEIAELVGELCGPALFFAVVWFIFAGNKPVVVNEGASLESTHPAVQNLRSNLSATARLGQVVYWFLGGASVVVGGLMLFAMAVNGFNIFALAIVGICLVLFAVGRAARYVLAGY